MDTITRIRTNLDVDIVGAILEGALRLHPPDHTLEGTTLRKAKMAVKAEEAAMAEAAFVANLKGYQPQLLDENQQKERVRAALDNGALDVTRYTPDILFL